MRVIAGTYRSRLLVSPPGTATRPTSDRLRETMFNILAARRANGLAGVRFADLYAGTGAVGIEAISRGAAYCWFSEKGAPALKSLRANLTTLKVPASAFTVDEKGTGSLLAGLSKKAVALDIIFLDPPYEAETEYEATLGLLGSASGGKLLAPGAVVLAEHASKSAFKLAARYGALQQTRSYRQGETSLAFYEVETGPGEL
jgi:16S rRNA (guanine(966)-N(2))-methyltransferase RsmD